MTVNARKPVTFCLQSSRSHRSAADTNGFFIDLHVINALQKMWVCLLRYSSENENIKDRRVNVVKVYVEK